MSLLPFVSNPVDDPGSTEISPLSDEVAQTVSNMLSLYGSGQLLDAYQLGSKWGPPTAWPGNQAKIIAGRILNNLGAPRLGSKLHYMAFRADPSDAEAIYYCNFCILERRGPLAAMDFWEKHTPAIPTDSSVYPDWLAMRATIAGIYRDFETAEEYLSRVQALGHDSPWIRVERSRLLEGQDQFDAALELARSSLELKPWFRPAVHHVAHLLQVLDRDEQALDLLENAVQHVQSVLLHQQLAALQDHLQLYPQAMRSLEKIDQLCPVIEKRFQRNLDILRSNVAYHAGDFSRAADFARASRHPFMERIAEKLRSHPPDAEKHPRVLLDFPFVRQHYMTCAPATLAAIGRFFKKPTDHLSVVDAICYDGTPSYSQRQWAQNNGWFVREFTLSWDAIVALIDRGVPFTLATVQLTSGHLQAVIGYDQMRGTLLCRDPYQYYITEFHAPMLLEQQAAGGPRAMVLVPQEQANVLDNLDLPDAALYDHLHALEKSLASHDRAGAVTAAAQLAEMAPAHRLALVASRALASYDRDSSAALTAVEGLLNLYPKDAPLLFSKALLLRALDRTDLLLPFLAEQCASHAVEASFLHLYAEQLKLHSADKNKSMALLKRALRRQPTHVQCLLAMGHRHWGDRELRKATDFYQLAASVDSLNEASVQTSFVASRHLKKTDAALSLLQKRFTRLISRSSQPAQTYFWALESLDRTVEAFQVLETAIQKRPQDGALLLYAADAFGRRGDFTRAQPLLNDAAGKTHQSQWLRASARLDSYRGDLIEALSTWQKVLDAEPLADDANREVASLIAQTQSPAAALDHLKTVTDRFPFNADLAQLRIVWLRSRGHAAVADAAAQLVARQPVNVWARVELSLSLAELGKAEQAVEHALAALEISPHSTAAHFAHGNALERMLKLEQAREEYRQAIRISVDYPFAMRRLVDSYASIEEKRSALAFVHQELLRQVYFGEGLLTYRREAASVIEPKVLLETLQTARYARPDLWQSWSMLIYQLSEMGLLDDAHRVARDSVDRFPLLPRVWYDLSYVAGLQADRPAKISALVQCLTLSPGWSFAARQLADTYRLEGSNTQAVAVLEKAIRHDPLDAENHHAYAWFLWQQKKQDAAIEHVKKAVMLKPGLEDAWQSLQAWLREIKREPDLLEFTREVCRQRAGESVAWLILARMLSGAQALEERLAAVDAALALVPLDIAAHDLKALLLVEKGAMQDAIKACNPPQFSGNPPIELRGREAWIHSRKDVAKAIAIMRQLLESNPSYHWGWVQLATWLSKRKSPAEYLTVAEAMVLQFPHDEVAQNHLVSAQLQNKDRTTAKQTLLSAVNLAPDNEFALNRLFDAQIKDRELDGAAETLKLIERHMRRSEFLRRQISLAAANGKGETAAAALGELCSAASFELSALTESVKAMDAAKMQQRVNEVFNQAAGDTADFPPAVAKFWTQRAAGANQWKACRKILDRFDATSDHWIEAAVVYCDALHKARQFGVLDRFIRAQLRRSDLPTRMWGQIGFLTFARNQTRRTIRRMRDWSERKDARPWMLLNLANAYRRINRFDLAAAVQRSAVQLPEDHTTLKHTVWLALDEVTAGQCGENFDKFSVANTTSLDKSYPYLVNLIRSLAPLCREDQRSSPDQIRTSKAALAKAAVKVPGWATQRELRIAMYRSVSRVVSCQPSIRNRLWKFAWLLRTRVVVRK